VAAIALAAGIMGASADRAAGAEAKKRVEAPSYLLQVKLKPHADGFEVTAYLKPNGGHVGNYRLNVGDIILDVGGVAAAGGSPDECDKWILAAEAAGDRTMKAKDGGTGVVVTMRWSGQLRN